MHALRLRDDAAGARKIFAEKKTTPPGSFGKHSTKAV